MTILGIDTSTPRAAVAAVAGGRLLSERVSEVRTHSERLLTLIDEVLGEAGVSLAELEGIAVGAGPGSFTGLRIGMATAKGLCFASGKPMWAVSSLAALALAAAHEHPGALLIPVLDARRKEVFVGAYVRGEAGLEAAAPEAVMAPAGVADFVRSIETEAGAPLLFGDGALLYRERVAAAGTVLEAPAHPSAADVARLASLAAPASLATACPVYIRKSEAEIRYPDGNPGGSFKPL